MRPLIANPSMNRAFEMKPVRMLLTRWLSSSSVIIDPFARNASWGTITNDLNEEMPTDYHMDADEFVQTLVDQGIRADAVLFDPPYSLAQAKECYETAGRHFAKENAWRVNRWTKTKNMLSEILNPNGVSISFGWSSHGFGKSRRFYYEEILMVCHSSGHHDTIVTVERKR